MCGASLGVPRAWRSCDWLVTWTYTRQTGRTAERLLYALRIRIFAHLQRLSVDYYDREMAGRIMTRMTTDVEALSQLLQTGLINAIVSILSFIGVLGPAGPVIDRRRARRRAVDRAAAARSRRGCSAAVSSRAYDRARDRIAAVNADLQESLSGVRVAQAYVREERNSRSFRQLGSEYLDARLDAQRLVAIYFPFVLFLLVDSADVIVLGVGSRRWSSTAPLTAGVADRVHPVPRPVLLADPAAVPGVRHVAAGRVPRWHGSTS